MSTSDSQTDLLIRWGAQLEQLSSGQPHPRTGRLTARLQEKVLRYLISRYRDPKLWNRHAARIQETSGTVRSQLPERKPQPRPLRSRRGFTSRLKSIRLANEESYRSYGL